MAERAFCDGFKKFQFSTLLFYCASQHKWNTTFHPRKAQQIKAVWHLVQHLSFLDNWYTNEPNEHAHTDALKRWYNSRKA